MMWAACLLTVLIEAPLMYLFGLRGRDELTVVVCANIATNLTMNLILGVTGLLPAAVFLEAAAVFAEYRVYRLCAADVPRLFLKTLAANAASLGLGLIFLPPAV